MKALMRLQQETTGNTNEESNLAMCPFCNKRLDSSGHCSCDQDVAWLKVTKAATVARQLHVKDIPIGDNFFFQNDQKQPFDKIRFFKKIDAVEDKWGNLFVAVQKNGRLLEVGDFKEEDVVIPYSCEI